MKSKRALSLVLVLMMVLSFAGVASAEKVKVNLWTTGSQNVSDMFTACIAGYNQLPDAKADVQLQFILSGAGDTALYDRLGAAFKTGQKDSGFDIIAENSTGLTQYVAAAGSEDLFAKLDFSMIPNYQNVKIKSAFDNDKVVPYRGTTVVFAYDSARVPQPPKTWAELTEWIKANPGRFAYNPPATGGSGGSFVQTVVYKDQPKETWTSSDVANKSFWDKGFDYLREIHPFLYQSGGHTMYPNKNQGTLDLLINKEVDIIPAWADQVLSNLSNGTLPETVKMMQLDQSLSGTDVVLAVPSIGSNAEACYDFINFMISPEAQKICLETMFAIPVIDPAMIESAKKDQVSSLDVSKFAIMSIGALSKDLNDKWDNEIGTIG
jgi:putative spermidine/putrescine transport system substrate-binding protein